MGAHIMKNTNDRTALLTVAKQLGKDNMRTLVKFSKGASQSVVAKWLEFFGIQGYPVYAFLRKFHPGKIILTNRGRLMS